MTKKQPDKTVIRLNAAIDLRALLGWIKQGERTLFKAELKIIIWQGNLSVCEDTFI